MIDDYKAATILGNSVNDFIDRNGTINKLELLNEITNNICLYILSNSREKSLGANSIESMFMSMLKDAAENSYIETTNIFTSAAMDLFPSTYTKKETLITLMDVQEKLGEDNGWENLQQYFLKKHGFDIEDM